uniref:Putative gamma-glutamyltransferase n=1 Tax=Corethrella appendiculata TaxID=1370023 RepID=U5EWG4_9DIPT
MIIVFLRKRLLLVTVFAAIVLIAVGVGTYFGLKNRDHAIDDGDYRRHGGAVVANGLECAGIGKQILLQNGSAADAAIATLFCDGITCPQSMGLGGGFLLTIYKRSTRKTETLIAREVAPLAATEDMFYGKPPNLSLEGGLSIAVPGELKGYWELHQKYGKLPWASLVQPSIDLCRHGHEVSPYLSRILRGAQAKILKEPTLSEVFINPATNRTWEAGTRIKRLALADSLEIIAKEGADALYSKQGTLLPKLLKDLKAFESIITEEDFLKYHVKWESAVESKILHGSRIVSIPAPGSGLLLNFMLNILNGYEKLNGSDPVTIHRIVESFKYGYAKRTEIGDPEFVDGIEEHIEKLSNIEFANEIRKQIMDDRTFNNTLHYGANFSNTEDFGTAHVNVIAPNGDAVSVTSTVNYILGAMLRSPSTGIILNDEMDDFSTPGIINGFGIPPSPANFIRPQKRPMSSMTPSIVINENNDVRLVIGGAGGSKITSAVTLVILQHLYFNKSLQSAMDEPRFHHQLMPMHIQHEFEMDANILNELKALGHGMQSSKPDSGFAALTALSMTDDHSISASWDKRRGGSKEVFD